MCAPFESTWAPSVASRFTLCIQYVITKFIYLSFVIDLIKRDHGISGPQPLTQQHIEFTSATAIFKFIALLNKIISERFRRGIRVLESTKNTALIAKWESANIDFICFANKGVNHRHRKSRPDIPRDSLRFVFQFSRAAADHFLRENLRNLRSGTMMATVACRYFPSAKRKVQCLRDSFAFA